MYTMFFLFFLQNNNIKTSKYSLLTFLPLNLFEQFQRLANFYFACLLILQLIDVISSLTPVTTAVPLVGVLTLIAIKDGYHDIVSRFNFFFFSMISIEKFVDLNFFFYQKFSFFYQKFSFTKNFFVPIYFYQKLFDPTFFFTKIFF